MNYLYLFTLQALEEIQTWQQSISAFLLRINGLILKLFPFTHTRVWVWTIWNNDTFEI